MNTTKSIISDVRSNATNEASNKYAAVWKKYEEKENTPSMQLLRMSIDDVMMDEVNYWYDQGYQIMSLGVNACGDGIPDDVCSGFNAQAEANIYPLYDYQQYSLVISKEISSTTIKNSLLATQWNQGYPFNEALTPINGQKSPVGCGAVALGQVMAYHKHPNTYNWNTILSQGGYSTITQNFMKDVAIVIGTKFGLNGSSSSTNTLVFALKTKYGYSPTVNLIAHNSTIVRAQLYYNQPVIMRGDRLDSTTNSYTGHAWVCDGYQTSTYYREHLLRVPVTETEYTTLNSYQSDLLEFHHYHMNWGWGGSGDGWFFEENVKPASSQNYKYNRYDIVNIKKQ